MSNLLLDPLTHQPSARNLQFFCNQLIDDSNPNVVYIAYSLIPGGPTDAIWRICRIRTNPTSGFKESFWAYDTTIQDGGPSEFTKVFTDRATYSY
jgi:hypothetical protein